MNMTVAERLDAEARRRSDTTVHSEPLPPGGLIPPEELDKMRRELKVSTAINKFLRGETWI